MTRRNALAKLLAQPCDWPACPCAERDRLWSDTFNRWDWQGQPQLSDEDVEGILLSLVAMLACMARHCRDRRVRQYATDQLLSPVFAEAMRGRWLN
jgi:hypothetical protein